VVEGKIDVSVIVAVRNGAETLAQCIDSVLKQTGCDVELIIVDALSEDGTQEIIESYGDAIATYIREADTGIYDAWNKALKVARGEWCSFLGADDYYLEPISVATLLKTARCPGPIPVFVYGGILRTGGPEPYVIHPDPPDVLAYLRSGDMLPHPGSLHRVGALRAIGDFDDSFRIAGDYAAVLQLIANGAARRCPEITTAMALGGISSDWQYARVSAGEKFRILRAERGALFAMRFVGTQHSIRIIGRIVEQATIAVFGQERGTAWLIRLRRLIGRPPKLI